MILLAVSVTAVLKLFFIVSTSFSAKISGANFPPIIALNSSVMLGSLSSSRSNVILVFFSLLIFIFCNVGVFEFFQIKRYSGVLQSPYLYLL